ncbi:MAG: hypothetical protein GY754_12135 [bacterium]|nr:hypothetical protein [bacterium]
MRILKLSMLCLLLTSILAISGCEAGLTSSDSSGSSEDGSDGFSFSDMYSNIGQLQEDIKNLSNTDEEIISQLNGSSTNLNGNIGELEEQISVLSNSVDTRIDLVNKDTADLNGDIGQLEKQTSDLSSSVDTRIDLVNGDIKSINDSRNIFSGNVGIGTATPQANLDVAGGLLCSVLAIRNPATGIGYKGNWIGTTDWLGDGKKWLHIGGITDENDGLRRTGYFASSHFFDGNVGIGTLEPDAKLQVNGKIRLGDNNVQWTKSNKELGVYFQSKGANPDDPNALHTAGRIYGDSIGAGWGNQVLVFEAGKDWEEDQGDSDNAFTTHQLVLRSGGNVGIGTHNPTSKLHVAGNITAVQCNETSDARFKKYITPIFGSLNKVLALQGVSYYWRTDEFKERGFSTDIDIGFIAQDVEKVLPEVVTTGTDGYKALAYSKMTVVLVEAIKEMKRHSDSKIAAIQKENDSLKKEVASLKSMNNRIITLEKQLNRDAGKLAYYAQ